MTTPEIRNRLIDLRSRIRRARFDADTDTLDVLTAELDRALDIYNQQRKAAVNSPTPGPISMGR